jgi:ribonucleoside-diphosphate reductase alpha chain
MSVAELKKYTFIAKYANWLEDKQRRETWKEAVERNKNMMFKKYEHHTDVYPLIEEAYEAVFRKEVLGSQRALQFAGSPVFKHNARLFNCVAANIDRLRFFQECMYLLMCGCGTGFSVQKHHIAKLPRLRQELGETKIFVIEDSIEGWSDSVGVLISSYFHQSDLFPEYVGKRVEFDFSQIRPAGSRLSSCAGKAPGPGPLQNSLEKIRLLLDRCLEQGLEYIRPIHAYDMVMFTADAVISGGIRRSATLCMFSHDDEEMCKAKTGNWFNENPQRGRSNNSAVLVRSEITAEEFAEVMSNTRQFGEPGFIFVANREQLFNPCVEISLYGYDENGNSGWQGCNLSTINCSKVKTKEDFLLACKFASIIGTLQAGFTSFEYLGEVSENIFKREALLGVSMTGIMENTDITLSPEIQREGAEEVKKWNKIVADMIGINPAARSTCVKPEGSASCLLGTSSGIHPHHAKRYIRRVQANKMETIYQHFHDVNPLACEESVWSTNGTDDVIAFCIEVEDGAKLKNQISAVELLETVKLTQQNWVESGKNKELCVKPELSHNVSNTITVKPNEWEAVESLIYSNRDYFCGISLLPLSGDKDYPQAPFTTVYLPHEIVSYYGDCALLASGLITEGLDLFDDNLWKASEAILGIVPAKGQAKRLYITRCKEFAEKYLFGDLRKLTYLLKDVYNWKLWIDLKREYKNVDYTECVELENNVKLEQELSCVGGACLI